jgi:hypothetical protein
MVVDRPAIHRLVEHDCGWESLFMAGRSSTRRTAKPPPSGVSLEFFSVEIFPLRTMRNGQRPGFFLQAQLDNDESLTATLQFRILMAENFAVKAALVSKSILDRGVPGRHSSPLRRACCFYGNTLSPKRRPPLE